MKTKLYKIVFFAFVINCSMLRAQMTATCNAPFNNATNLVDILVSGVPFSNATLNGFDCSAGFFESANPNDGLLFENGLVMATGGLGSIDNSAGGGFGGGAGEDPDLEAQLNMVGASNNNLNNLIVLEFDFEPNSNQIAFEYVFASHEYPGYTCSQYNDIFGFFLSGPGIDGPFENDAVNIALVPDPDNPTTFTNTPVIINTLNSGIASGNSGPCDEIDPNWQEYSVFFNNDNSSLGEVPFPGFTMPLIATYEVIPCETYHIKLAIADVADGILNSAVFLKENSFSSIGNYVISDSEYGPWIGNDTTLVEGCFDGELTFGLTEAIETDYVIDFTVSGTATEGVDYEALGSQAVIPMGETETTIPLIPFYDGAVEGNETLSIEATVTDGCSEEDVEFNFLIVDRLEMYMDTIADNPFCPDDDVLFINPYITGGIQPMTYEWYYNGSLISNQQAITILPENVGNYTIHAEGLCDSEVSDSFETYVLEPDLPLTILSGFQDIEACMGDEFSTQIQLEGGIGEVHYYWTLNGFPYQQDLNFVVPTELPFEYNLELNVNDECSNVVSQDFIINIEDCFIPNVFSPNDDGVNDFWYVNFGEVVENVRVDIYNRWGQKVFAATNYELCDEETGLRCWNGENMSNDEQCPDGSYFYTVELLDGRKHKGFFKLYR